MENLTENQLKYQRAKITEKYILRINTEIAKEKRRINAAKYYNRKREIPEYREYIKEKSRKQRERIKVAKLSLGSIESKRVKDSILLSVRRLYNGR